MPVDMKLAASNRITFALGFTLFAFFCNYPKHVADNYKRFRENLIRKQYGFKGVPMTLSFKEK